nr:hypothetical protein [Hyphomonas sp. Mor2]
MKVGGDFEMIGARLKAVADNRPMITAALLCLVFYIPFVGFNIYTSGYNPDEWRFASGLEVEFANVHMRWATHIGHNVLFGGAFFDFAHASLTFFPLFFVAWLISQRAFSGSTSWVRIATAVLLFLAGSLHVYLTEILHYQTLALWFTLGLLLSVCAQVVIEPRESKSTFLGECIRVAIAAELIALSLGFYQSFVFLGFALPAIALIRTDKYSIGQLIPYFARVLIAAALAIILNQLQLSAVILILGLDPYFRFGDAPSLEIIVQKLRQLPWRISEIYSGGLLGIPGRFQIVFKSLTGLVLLLPLIGAALTLRKKETGVTIDALRILVGSYGVLAFLPTLLWFVYPEPWLIPRSIGWVGFLFAAILLANVQTISNQWEAPQSKFRTTMFAICALGAVAATSLLASAQFWPSFRETATRDIALADDILSAAGDIPGFDIEQNEIRTVGGVRYDDLAFGRFRTLSTFHRGVDMNSIFMVRHGAVNPAGSLPFSPRACPEFPAPGSIFLSDDVLYACLERSSGPPALDQCLPVGLDENRAALCWTEDLVILAAAQCDTLSLDRGDLKLDFVSTTEKQSLMLHHQYRSSPVNGTCVRVVSKRLRDFETVSIERNPRREADEMKLVVPYETPRPAGNILEN